MAKIVFICQVIVDVNFAIMKMYIFNDNINYLKNCRAQYESLKLYNIRVMEAHFWPQLYLVTNIVCNETCNSIFLLRFPNTDAHSINI